MEFPLTYKIQKADPGALLNLQLNGENTLYYSTTTKTTIKNKI